MHDKNDGYRVRTNAGSICVRKSNNDGTNGGGSNGKSDRQKNDGNNGEVLENQRAQVVVKEKDAVMV